MSTISDFSDLPGVERFRPGMLRRGRLLTFGRVERPPQKPLAHFRPRRAAA